MSATASVGELERIAQAIALADGFQLLVLECEPLPAGGLKWLLQAVLERVANLRGQPMSIVWLDGVYDAHLFLNEFGGNVLVIDGSDVTVGPTGRVSGESNWRFLFQRLNERRNAIVRSQVSTLILALTPALSRIFFEEAPDMASIRGGMFQIDATMLRADLRPVTAPVSRRSFLSGTSSQQIPCGVVPPHEFGAHDRLQELLLDLFRTNELYRFVGYNFPDVTLPESVSPSDVALAVVDQLDERGWIGRNLFERLARVRPDHRDEIDEVAQLWGFRITSATERGAGPSVLSNLHERLLELTPDQRDAVVYLAGFAGDDSAHTTRTLPERSPTSARELLARAQSEGPEALARLADAIDLVTARE